MKNSKLIIMFAVILVFIFLNISHAASLLSDDFESYSSFPSGTWANASGNGSWSIVTDGSKVARQTSTSSATYLMVNGESTWRDYTYSAQVKPGSSGNRHGLVARFKDTKNYYFLILKDGSKVYLYKRVNGSESSLDYASFTYNSSTFYTLKIELIGTSIKGYINGNLMVSATDSSINTGKIGFYTYGNASFDNVSVTDTASTPTPTPTPTPTQTATPTPTPSSEVKLGLSIIEASADDGNVPTNVLDANLSTRFSSNGDGAYIILGADSVTTLSSVKIAWHNGSSRQFYFEIYTSTDNQSYTKAYPASGYATSSGNTTGLEEYNFSDRSARYIKVIGHENSYNTWFSPTEIEAWGIPGDPLPTPTTTLTPTPTPTATPTPTPTATPTPTPGGSGITYNVSNSSQWTTAVNSVQPGDTIRVTANISSGISIKNKTASESNPIYIVAANPQQTTLHSLTVDNCQGIVVQGFKFGPNTAGVLMKVVNSKYIKILRNYFDHNNISTSQSTIVTTQASQYIEVAYNLFDRKNVGTVSGSYIKTQYDAPNVTKNMYIHHNHFKNIVPMPSGDTFDGDSDREAIVLGISSTQDIMTDHIIEYNLFEDCDGENEIITVKTSRNIIRYNTFKNCLGSVSVRFGTQTEVYGNFFIGVGASASINDPNHETGGIRVYGSHHKVYNNYMQGLSGTSYRVPLCLDGGDTSDSSGGDGHERPTYCEFTNNTIVNCAWGIGVGTHYSLSPQNCKISNNIISNSQNQLFVLTRCDSTNTFEGNIAWPTGSASLGTSKTQNEIWQTNPNLTTVGSLQKLASTSPAINYSKGSYTYINDDMDGQARMSVNDAGADEYSTSPVTRGPLTASDVGYNAP